MLANTLTLTIYGLARTLVRFREVGTSSVYRLRDGNALFMLTVKQSGYQDKIRKMEVKRHAFDLTITVDPTAPAIIPEIRKAYFVLERDERTTALAMTDLMSSLGAIMSTPGIQTPLVNEEY